MHYNPHLSIKLSGVGAVISHILPDGSEHPASRTLFQVERNYAQLEKEALSLILGIKKFPIYLYGWLFTLDKTLLCILGPKKGIPELSAARLQRWVLILAAYNYKIEFGPTQKHGNEDGFSRLPLPEVTHSNPDVNLLRLQYVSHSTN